MFRYTSKDAWPALLAVANVALFIASILLFDSLPFWAIGILFVVLAFGFCWNLHGIAHAFIHTPFFSSEWLNRAFSLLESFNLGVPQTLHHMQHMNHHSGNNDVPGPDGKTRDWVSTYRHGKDGKPEAFWSYCLLSFFRVDIPLMAHLASRRGKGYVIQVLAELVFLFAIAGGLLIYNWQYFVFFYIPCYYLGWVLIYAENYFLHYGAEPGNRYANAVSSYHDFTNWLFFNNGYHQEHHTEPKVHWTKMPELRQRLAPHLAANDTKVLKGPHLTVFLEDYLNRRRATAAKALPYTK